MNKESLQKEIDTVERHYNALLGMHWSRRERKIEWCDMNGKEKWPGRATRYEILQLSTITTKGKIVVIKTMFTRDSLLHRLSGPAYSHCVDKSWWVAGKEYSELEFDFFIKGMVT